MNKTQWLVGQVLVGCLLISGCASKMSVQEKPDNQIHQLVENYRMGDPSITYEKLWEAYLQSSQTENTSIVHDQYLTKKNQLDAGVVECHQVDWEALVKLNYWSIQPHLTAADCLLKAGNLKDAEFHENFVGMILQGIFSSGTGKHYYDAFEVASWGDVEDVLNLAGYRTIDQYLELRGAAQGVYYVVVAEDSQTGMQEEIFFDNIRFINSALGFNSRLGDRSKSLGQMLVEEMANSNSHVAIALGDMLVAEKEYESAAEWYIKASLSDSPIAFIKVALLCLKNRLPSYSDGACLEFVAKGAELEYANAYVLLSALYTEGIWVEKDNQLAHDFMQAASNKKGEGKAYAELASLYRSGLFGEDNEVRAMTYYQKASQLGVVEDEYVSQLRGSAFNDDGEIQDTEKARQEILTLAENGNELAQTYIGAHYIYQGNKHDDVELARLGIDYIRKAAEQKLPHAQHLMGLAYKFGFGIGKDYEEAIAWFYKAAQSWDADSQYEVASYLRHEATKSLAQGDANGILLAEQNSGYAFDWMNSAARQGHVDAINSLGYYYNNGIGTTKNLESAASLYKIAFELNHKYGSYNYAHMLRYGQGVTTDYPRALKGFQQAADQGHAGSANEIGLMYENGVGVDKNLTEAFKWFRKAAQDDYQWAQYNLGRCYEFGLGVNTDIALAKEWYKKAAAQGHAESKKRLGVLNAA
jgi:uncharacterized protein